MVHSLPLFGFPMMAVPIPLKSTNDIDQKLLEKIDKKRARVSKHENLPSRLGRNYLGTLPSTKDYQCRSTSLRRGRTSYATSDCRKETKYFKISLYNFSSVSKYTYFQVSTKWPSPTESCQIKACARNQYLYTESTRPEPIKENFPRKITLFWSVHTDWPFNIFQTIRVL